MQAADYIEFLVKVSIVEIYNERRNAELGQTHTCRFLLLRHSGFVGSEEGQLENPRGQGLSIVR